MTEKSKKGIMFSWICPLFFQNCKIKKLQNSKNWKFLWNCRYIIIKTQWECDFVKFFSPLLCTVITPVFYPKVKTENEGDDYFGVSQQIFYRNLQVNQFYLNFFVCTLPELYFGKQSCRKTPKFPNCPPLVTNYPLITPVFISESRQKMRATMDENPKSEDMMICKSLLRYLSYIT